MSTKRKSEALAGGKLVFRTPYGGRAAFDWHLDRFGHDVIVECTTWEGLKLDLHRINMGPRFASEEARRLAQSIARRIIKNLDYVVRNRQKDIEFVSDQENAQLPLYRKWAWEEAKRRMRTVDLVAESYKDDDDDDESPAGVLSEKHIASAEAEFSADNEIELIEER